MVELIGSWIIQFITSLGYWGVFGLMTLESALIPIPSEVTMPFAGSLVASGTFNFWLVVAAGTIGNLVGSLVAYALGWWGQEAVVRKLIVRYGKYLLITEHEYDASERWFKNHGELIVFVSRVLPVVRTFISLPAGVAKMRFWRFVFYTAVGCFVWVTILTKIGVILGERWNSLEVYFRKFDVAIAVAAIVVVVWYLWKKFRFFR